MNKLTMKQILNLSKLQTYVEIIKKSSNTLI